MEKGYTISEYERIISVEVNTLIKIINKYLMIVQPGISLGISIGEKNIRLIKSDCILETELTLLFITSSDFLEVNKELNDFLDKEYRTLQYSDKVKKIKFLLEEIQGDQVILELLRYKEKDKTIGTYSALPANVLRYINKEALNIQHYLITEYVDSPLQRTELYLKLVPLNYEKL